MWNTQNVKKENTKQKNHPYQGTLLQVHSADTLVSYNSSRTQIWPQDSSRPQSFQPSQGANQDFDVTEEKRKGHIYPDFTTPDFSCSQERLVENIQNGNIPTIQTSDQHLESGIIVQSPQYQWVSHTFRCNPYTALLLFLSLGLATFTGVYASGSATKLLNIRFFSSTPSNSLLTLRILSEVSSVTSWAFGLAILEDFQWALASRFRGVNVLNFVALDRGTGFWGLIRLLFRIPVRYKASILIRLLFICCLPIPGVLIMSDISINQIFLPVVTHSVSAGLAPYNASLSSNLQSEWKMSICVNVGNPSWSALNSLDVSPLPLTQGGGCSTTGTANSEWAPCDEAYFMSGGIELVAPQFEMNETSNFTDATSIVVPRTMGYHIEFGSVNDLQSLRSGICDVRGDDSGAVFWCVAKGAAHEFKMGGVYCPINVRNANQCINDTSWTDTLMLSTTVFIYRQSASVYYHRSNLTILRVSELSTPEPVDIPLVDALIGLNAVSLISNNCSDLFHFADATLPASDSENAAIITIRQARAVFSTILQYFHANFVGADDSTWVRTSPRVGLPPDMYTTSSFARPLYQATASRMSLQAFVGVQGALMLILAVITIFSWHNISDWPKRTGYPGVDFAVNCLQRGGILGKLAEMKSHPSRSLPTEVNHMRIWAGERKFPSPSLGLG